MAKLILNPRFLDDRLEPTPENGTAVLEGEVFAFMFDNEFEGLGSKPEYVVFANPKMVVVQEGLGMGHIAKAYPIPPVFDRIRSKISETTDTGGVRIQFRNANVRFMPVFAYDDGWNSSLLKFVYDDRKGEFVKEELTMDELRANYGLRCILPKDLAR